MVAPRRDVFLIKKCRFSCIALGAAVGTHRTASPYFVEGRSGGRPAHERRQTVVAQHLRSTPFLHAKNSYSSVYAFTSFFARIYFSIGFRAFSILIASFHPRNSPAHTPMPPRDFSDPERESAHRVGRRDSPGLGRHRLGPARQPPPHGKNACSFFPGTTLADEGRKGESLLGDEKARHEPAGWRRAC